MFQPGVDSTRLLTSQNDPTKPFPYGGPKGSTKNIRIPSCPPTVRSCTVYGNGSWWCRQSSGKKNPESASTRTVTTRAFDPSGNPVPSKSVWRTRCDRGPVTHGGPGPDLPSSSRHNWSTTLVSRPLDKGRENGPPPLLPPSRSKGFGGGETTMSGLRVLGSGCDGRTNSLGRLSTYSLDV